MASRIARNPRRKLDPGGQGSRQRQREKSEPRPIPIGPPWGGFAPDLSSELSDWRFAADSQGLIQKGGILRGPPGFSRLGASTLPLGDATPPAASAQPVVGLYAHRDPVSVPLALRRYATTADATLGFLAELQNDLWTDIPYTGAGAGLSGDPSGVGVAATLTDFASFAGDNIVVFTNGFDPVYVHAPGGANYTDFSPVTLAPFTAKSVCAAADRVLFLNTTESGGAPNPYLFRYTTRGAAPVLSGLGAGFINLTELRGEGVAVRPLGDLVVCYSRKGIALLRQTGDINDPFKKERIFTDRGLVGTFAVCEVGRGQHFGIFDDGWFYFYDDGRFEQLGLLNTDGGLFSKWKSYFYSQINQEQIGRTFVQYDRVNEWIWILWVSKESDHPDRLWIYDIKTDSVWPIDRCFPEVPNVLAQAASVGTTETYATVSSTYATEVRTYSDMIGKVGADLLVAGTRSGLVFQQGPALAAFDGVFPDFSWTSPEKNLGRTDLLHTWQELLVRFVRQAEVGAGITVGLSADEQTLYSIIAQPGGSSAELVRYVNQVLTGSLLGFSLSGTHPTEITQLHAAILETGMKARQQ